MKMKKFNTILATSLIFASLFPMGVMASPVAPSIDGTTSVTSAGSNTDVPVKITAEAATFSVTVPSSLPVALSSDGEVVTATNGKITNNSPAPVKITNIAVTPQGEWKTTDYDSFVASKEKVNTKKFAIKLFDDVKTTDDNGTLSSLTKDYVITAKDGVKNITYDVKAPVRNTELTSTVANIVVTIGWDA